jgi:hypothetical protein
VVRPNPAISPHCAIAFAPPRNIRILLIEGEEIEAPVMLLDGLGRARPRIDLQGSEGCHLLHGEKLAAD